MNELFLEHGTFVRSLKKNTTLHFPQMSRFIYFLRKGFLKLAVMNEEGKEVIKYILKEGSFFGTMSLLDQQENCDEYAVALEDCFIVFIETDKIKLNINSYPKLASEALKQLGERMKKSESRLLSMIFKDASSRICEFLIQFATEFGKLSGDAYQVRSFLTHDDIAKLTATSRQTVSSILNDLREQKQIEYNNEIIRIPVTSEIWKVKNTSQSSTFF
jgi:CRP/FNR family transcriptional regulator, cyclic AMP receptor protein